MKTLERLVALYKGRVKFLKEENSLRPNYATYSRIKELEKVIADLEEIIKSI